MSRRNGGIVGPTNTPVGGLMTGVASGVWRMNDVLTFVSNNQWPSGPQNIDNSCRFEDGNNDYLVKTFVTPTNQYLYTISMWVKRSLLGSNQTLFGVGDDGSNNATLKFTSDDQIQIYDHISGVDKLQKKTNRLFRDTSAWYHIFVSSDRSISSPSTQIYINGVQVTSFAANTEYSQNDSGKFNTAVNHYLGVYTNNSEKFSGYIAEAVFVDGLALAHTDFGETDSTTGIWKPKKIGKLGDVGNNTFYLDFKDSSSLGNDASGKNNDFTATNLTSIDQSTDTCVENFATLNPLDSGTITFSDGNLTATSGSDYHATKGTIAVNAGKWYFEAKINTPAGGSTVDQFIGITGDNTAISGTTYDNNPSVLYTGSGTIRKDGTTAQSSLTAFVSGQIIGVALNMDDLEIEFYNNGTKQGSTQSISSFTGFYIPFYIGANYRGASFNFGSPVHSISSGNADANGFGNFEYSVPSGYYALNTSNLNTYG